MFRSPAFILGSAIGSLWAAIFYLGSGKKLADLVLYWFVGLVGFFVGHAIAEALGFHWLMLGQVHILSGTLGCWIAMLVARWLKV